MTVTLEPVGQRLVIVARRFHRVDNLRQAVLAADLVSPGAFKPVPLHGSGAQKKSRLQKSGVVCKANPKYSIFALTLISLLVL